MKKYIYSGLISLCALVAQAQQTANFTQIFNNQYLFSPAYAGQSSETKAFFHYRNQMLGFKGAPEIMMFTIDKAIPVLKTGLGLQLFKDKTNVYNRSGANLSLNYQLPVATDQKLRFGMSFGAANTSIDLNQIVGDVNEFNGIRSITSFNADMGLTYSRKQLDIAFAATNVFNMKSFSEYSDLKYIQNPVYALLAKTQVAINQDFKFEPWAVVKTSQGLPFQASLMAIFKYRNLLSGGLTYDSKSSVGATVGISYDDFSFGYNYGYPTSILSTISGGIHEVSVGFTFRSRKPKTVDGTFIPENPDSLVYVKYPEKQVKENKSNNGKGVNVTVQNNVAKSDTTYHVIVFPEGEDMESLKKMFMGDHKTYLESSEKASITVDETKLDELERIEGVKGLKDHTDAFFTLFPNGKADIVIAAHKTIEHAKAYQKSLKRFAKLNTFLVKSKGEQFYYVVTNQVYSFKEANAEIKKLKKLGLENYIYGNIWLFGE
jgi:type IX secretion system PorP/SprF family membrane protein